MRRVLSVQRPNRYAGPTRSDHKLLQAPTPDKHPTTDNRQPTTPVKCRRQNVGDDVVKTITANNTNARSRRSQRPERAFLRYPEPRGSGIGSLLEFVAGWLPCVADSKPYSTFSPVRGSRVVVVMVCCSFVVDEVNRPLRDPHG